MRPHPLLLSVPALVVAGLALSAGPTAPVYDVRDFGAKGDGRTIDTPAIAAAIDAAATAGGGTVYLPAGTYPSYSIRLKSHITLQLGAGATLLAAQPSPERGRYDAPEPNEHDVYQDFGHSHWQNSLIWGIGLEDVEILGPGRIDGAGLTRRGPGARWSRAAGDRPLSMGAAAGASGDPEATARQAMDGQGNKAIALKLCRNVRLRGFSILNGGHFAILATGVDNLAIDGLTIDTNRDGIDIDACRHVRVSNTAVNSPNDDAIVLKSSYALGVARATEHVTITNCQVSGYDPGTFVAGTFGRTQERAPDRDGPTGRIKLGTESSGGFRNITISNCVFTRSRGLALETVDGGDVEDVTVTGLTMREVTTAPLFLRLGNRGRTPRQSSPWPDAAHRHQQHGRQRRRSTVPGPHCRSRRPSCRGRGSHQRPHPLPGRRHPGGRGAGASRERDRLSRTQHVRHAARVRVLSAPRQERDLARRGGGVRGRRPAPGVRPSRRRRRAFRSREGQARARRTVRAASRRAPTLRPRQPRPSRAPPGAGEEAGTDTTFRSPARG